MSDLELDRPYKRNDKGPKVRLVQEWLCLHDIQVKLDGEFGPATEGAVKLFQQRSGLEQDGVVGPLTFSTLIRPMTDAIQTLPIGNGDLGGVVVLYAHQHLKSQPQEVGGENMGPWVRLYMNGLEGPPAKWCAGFACYVLKQACDTIGAPLPLQPSYSCDELANRAKQRGIFLAGGATLDHSPLKPGSLFLNRKTPTDWYHTGIVTHVNGESFQTIEGNTNEDGSAEGFEVCERVRPYGSRDFVLIH
jgi:hypothetical protein